MIDLLGLDHQVTGVYVRRRVQIKDMYQLIQKHNADIGCSYVVTTNTESDIAAGNFVGLKTVLIGPRARPRKSVLIEQPLITVTEINALNSYFTHAHHVMRMV